MPTDPESILSSTKDALNIMDDDTSFDAAIILFINSVLADLNQLGIGPNDGLVITDDSTKWIDLIGDEKRYEGVKAYMYLCVRMLFDPPQVGYVITAYKELKDRMEYRINRAREDIDHPSTETSPSATEDPVEPTPVPVHSSSITEITAGLPFARRVRIANGKNFWSDLADFEARMQLRASKSPESELLFDFTPWLLTSFDNNDILVEWNLTGAQTRTLQSGYFDLVLSDVGTIDGSAIRALSGYLRVLSTITAA